MDNDHGITGELREWAKALSLWWYDPVKDEYTYTTGTMPPSIDAIRLDEHILAIADRIDAEHERLMQEQPFTIDMVPITDENMAEHGWVKLPVDADGEYIHIGDMMENGERVARIVLTDGSWDPSVYTAKTPNQLREYFCREISHYHAPTVEDVLREFAQRWDDPTHYAKGELVEQYAAKLRLAGGDAE